MKAFNFKLNYEDIGTIFLDINFTTEKIIDGAFNILDKLIPFEQCQNKDLHWLKNFKDNKLSKEKLVLCWMAYQKICFPLLAENKENILCRCFGVHYSQLDNYKTRDEVILNTHASLGCGSCKSDLIDYKKDEVEIKFNKIELLIHMWARNRSELKLKKVELIKVEANHIFIQIHESLMNYETIKHLQKNLITFLNSSSEMIKFEVTLLF